MIYYNIFALLHLTSLHLTTRCAILTFLSLSIHPRLSLSLSLSLALSTQPFPQYTCFLSASLPTSTQNQEIQIHPSLDIYLSFFSFFIPLHFTPHFTQFILHNPLSKKQSKCKHKQSKLGDYSIPTSIQLTRAKPSQFH
ncbi:hypothetical protein BKA61DRAFT_97749 [Leptodontidium sp. MPI-SDFR-AT-0119]|nr:hypothetical protein BKA61DRAFT_97749 [Leptodontidium sp. MPI-SDFR-AT-0119]